MSAVSDVEVAAGVAVESTQPTERSKRPRASLRREVGKADCGADCMNRQSFVHCDSKTCPCGTSCSNRQELSNVQIRQVCNTLNNGGSRFSGYAEQWCVSCVSGLSHEGALKNIVTARPVFPFLVNTVLTFTYETCTASSTI